MHAQPIALAFLVAALAGCGSKPMYVPGKPNAPIEPERIVGPASVEYDTPPKLVTGNAPIYPLGYQMERRAGRATISFAITEDGRTEEFEVVATDARYWADHAIIAVQQWRFTPATKDGKPVRVRVVMPFHYELPS
jgi:periplasmic protein TonB